MPFQKGSPRPAGAGRKPGQVNRATLEIRDITAKLFDAAYFASVRKRLLSGELAPAIEAKLLAYRFGEPRQGIDIDANVRSAVKVVHEHVAVLASAPQLTSSREH